MALLKYLRIAVTALCLTACVLLVALWVRSYTWPDVSNYRMASFWPEAEFTLVQDEFDVQEGMDVTLWTQPVGTPIEKTLHLY